MSPIAPVSDADAPAQHPTSTAIQRTTRPSPAATSDEVMLRAVNPPQEMPTRSCPSILSAHEVMVLMPSPNGMYPRRVTPASLLNMLNRMYAHQPAHIAEPGDLTRLIEALSPLQRYSTLDKKLAVAFSNVTPGELGGQLIERKVFEAGVLAVWDGCFQYVSQKDFCIANGFVATERDHFEMGQKIVDVLVRNNVVRLNDPTFSVLDIGTAFGVVPMLLAQMGVQNVRAIEPYSIQEARSNFKDTEPFTARQLMVHEPGVKFSVVLNSNFSPFISSGNPDPESDILATRDMFYCMAMMTADNGQGWAGFNGIGTSHMRPPAHW